MEGSRKVVLFLPCPQNHLRKCLCNLRTLKPRRVNIPSSVLALRRVCSSTTPPSISNSIHILFKCCLLWKIMFEPSDHTRKHLRSKSQQPQTSSQHSYRNLNSVHRTLEPRHLFNLLLKILWPRYLLPRCHLLALPSAIPVNLRVNFYLPGPFLI